MDRLNLLFDQTHQFREQTQNSTLSPQAVLNGLEQIQHTLDYVREGFASDEKPLRMIRSDSIPTYAETVQNLEVDAANWGCARSGFVYKRKENWKDGKTDSKMTPVSPTWSVEEKTLTLLEEQRKRLREKLESIEQAIQINTKQI